MTEKSLVFECMSCHQKWTTPTMQEQKDMQCPECGKKNVILNTDDTTPTGKTRDNAWLNTRNENLSGGNIRQGDIE